MMYTKKLQLSRLHWIYHTYLIHDFPKAEIKPWNNIEQMYRNQFYYGYGFYDSQNNQLVAYAFFVKGLNTLYPCSLLDYFAVLSHQRCRGLGSICLSLLKKEIPTTGTLLLESEHPDFAVNEEDFLTRSRRLRFYFSNGLLQSSVTSCLFGVEYRILYVPEPAPLTEEHIRQGLTQIYSQMFPQERMGTDVIIHQANS